MQDTDALTISHNSIRDINVNVKAIVIFIFIYIAFSHILTTMILPKLFVIYQCPNQRGSTEYGYYVCKNMLDIVYRDDIKPRKKFQPVRF